MNAKLTLKLEEDLIAKAKIYSKNNNISLSRLIAKFFSTLDVKKYKNEKISPIVKEISGIIDAKLEINGKENKKRRLIKKYI